MVYRYTDPRVLGCLSHNRISRSYVGIECFYFGTELAMVERFYVATECCQRLEILCARKIMLRHGWLGREDFCCDRIFYVARELAKVRRNYVTAKRCAGCGN